MPRYDRHIDRIVNAQRIVGLMARLPHCCWRDAFDGVAGVGPGYNVSFFVEVASRRAKCEKVKKKAVYYKVLFNITCE